MAGFLLGKRFAGDKLWHKPGTKKVSGVRYLAAITVILIYAAFCLICWIKYRQRERMADKHIELVQDTVLIAYASQTGNAEHLAQKSAQQLQQAGLSCRLLSLHKVDEALLAQTYRALFVVSTYGEGEPPDTGTAFVRRYLSKQDGALAHLQFGILALGDRDYRHFCGFGHTLNHGLHHRGATLLFDVVEVDKHDESALRHWQYYLGQLSGQTHFPDWSQPGYEAWRLHARACLNPDSPKHPAFHIQLQPAQGIIAQDTWQAGDIAEIGPCNPPTRVRQFLRELTLDGHVQVADTGMSLEQMLMRRRLPEQLSEHYRSLSIDALLDQLPELPHREYSIASLPEDGTLDLIVRQVQLPEQTLGLGSGWLTAYAQPGDDIALRVRVNQGFHAPADDRPIILVGNGTGLAGLRAHLRARVRAGHRRNWLLFGERTLANDFFFADEILAWKKQGFLAHLDLAFSRDQDTPRYVQHLLLEKPEMIRQWIEEGAAIYVCGSLAGMAQGVDEALREILGEELLEALADDERYCRDVY